MVCVIINHQGDAFSATFNTTIGVDFELKTMRIKDKNISLQAWDTAGQCRFRTITTSYYKSCDCILVRPPLRRRRATSASTGCRP
jgi:GTPase SAR1 family protein